MATNRFRVIFRDYSTTDVPTLDDVRALDGLDGPGVDSVVRLDGRSHRVDPSEWRAPVGTVYGMWHGGSSYSHGYVPEDVERFASEDDARDALLSRYRDGYGWRQSFDYVNRPADSVLTPAVGEDSTLVLYRSDPSDAHDPYPDRVLSLSVTDDGDVTVVAEDC